MLFNRVSQRRGQTNATFHRTQNISHFTRASTTNLHGGQTSTTSYNIKENTRNVVSYNICLVKNLIAIKLHTTRYNTIQQGGQTSATFHTTSKLYDVV